MIKSPCLLGFVLIFFAAARAFAQKINIEFDQRVDFGKYHTFAIRHGELNSQNPALNSELVKKQIDADSERYISARGLQMGPPAKWSWNNIRPGGAASQARKKATLLRPVADETGGCLAWPGIVFDCKLNVPSIAIAEKTSIKRSEVRRNGGSC